MPQRKDSGNEMKMLKHEPRQCNWPIGFLAIRQEADGWTDGRRSLTSMKFPFALLAFFHLCEKVSALDDLKKFRPSKSKGGELGGLGTGRFACFSLC